MRDVLTGLAVAIITLLSIALVGPLLIDWSGQRARIETLLADTLGTRVQIGGAIDVRFLPTPRLVLERAQFGERPGPALSLDRVTIELATMPLLKGEILILESRLSGARLILTRTAEGGFALPAQTGTHAAIEKLTISDGRLQIRDAGGKIETDLAFSGVEADAGALEGPWRVSGRMRAGSETRDLRLALSAPNGDGQRMRLTLIDNDGDRSDFDGRLHFAQGTADGKFTRQGHLLWPQVQKDSGKRPYTITAQLALEPQRAIAPVLDVEIGDDAAALKLSGSAEWAKGAPLSVRLEGKSLDLDRPLRSEASETGLTASTALAEWARVLGGVAGEFPAMSLALGLPNAILGGEAVRAVQLKAELRDAAFRITEFTADAPGQTRITARGDLAFGAAPRFSGPVTIDSRDPARFAIWMEGDAGRERFPLRADLRADAELFITRETIAASKLSVSYDRTQVTGAARLQRSGERARLEAQLVSERFALETLPDLGGLTGTLGDLDAMVSFEVRQLDFGQEWRGGKMRLRVEKVANRIALPLFELTDQAGLSVRATGNLQGEGGRLDATLDLPQVAPAALIVRRLYGGPYAEAVAKRASSLSPFRGRFSLFRDKDAYRIEANGRAAGTDLALAWRTSADMVDGNFEVRAPEVAPFLKQAGLTVVPLAGRSTGARVTGTFKGAADKPVWAVRFESGQTRIVFDGNRGENGFSGQVKAESDDLTPWLQVLALPAPPIGERVPFALTAKVAEEDALALNDIDARLGSARLKGQLNLKSEVIGGALTFDNLSFETLAGLAVGPVNAPLPTATWPSQRFAPPMVPTFRTAITLSAPSLTLPFGYRGDEPRLDLRWSGDGLELSDAQFRFAGGEWRGALALKRQGSLVSFSSRTQWNGVDVATLWPQSGMGGKAFMTLDLGASGESVAAMIVSLLGGGRLRVENGSMTRLDARRVMPVIASADQGRDAPDQRVLRDAVLKALDTGPLSVDAFETTLGVANGAVRIGPAAMTAAFAQGQALALYDLKTMRLDARLTMQMAGAGARDWAAAPQWGVQWRSLPNGVIAREIDVATLNNLLTTRYVARELQRIEAEEADLRERNFFIRRQRSEKLRLEERVRQEEIRRAEEEARKAREEAERILELIPPTPVEPAQSVFQ